MEIATTPAVSTAEVAPATSHIRSEDFELGLLVSRRLTICLFYQFATSEPGYCQKSHGYNLPKKEQF
jgi:hypothetical protein